MKVAYGGLMIFGLFPRHLVVQCHSLSFPDNYYQKGTLFTGCSIGIYIPVIYSIDLRSILGGKREIF